MMGLVTVHIDHYPIFEYFPYDITPPVIIINYPFDGAIFISPPDYDIDLIEDNVDTIWYTIDNGLNNRSIVSTFGTIDESDWNALPDGSVNIVFYANDTAGNIGSVQVTVIKDTTNPVIIINNPNYSDQYSASPPSFDINLIEINLDSIWYTMDDGLNNFTIISTTGSLNMNTWNLLLDGSITVTFYANDTAGNIGFTQVTVIKDTISPVITIIVPINDGMYSSSPPDYDIDIFEDHLDLIWYSMDDGVNNFTISSFSGFIDAIAWNLLSDGPILITFYANDGAGNIGSAQVTIYKDTTAPKVVINKPETGDEFTATVPLYDIDIEETNLDTIWYTMNGGLNITFITIFTGILEDQSPLHFTRSIQSEILDLILL